MDTPAAVDTLAAVDNQAEWNIPAGEATAGSAALLNLPEIGLRHSMSQMPGNLHWPVPWASTTGPCRTPTTDTSYSEIFLARDSIDYLHLLDPVIGEVGGGWLVRSYELLATVNAPVVVVT